MAGARATCREHGMMLIGDLPIFVAHDSADVSAHPELFHLDSAGSLGRGRCAAGLFQPDRPVMGQPPLSTGKPMPPRIMRGGSPGSRSCSAESTSFASITFAGSRRTGRYPPARRRPRRVAGCQGRGGTSSRPCAGQLGSLPLDRRGPRGDHPRRREPCATSSACPE